MIRLEETRRIARSLEDCYRYLLDFSTIEQWDPGVYRAEKVTPGKTDVGTEFRLILNSAGRRVPMTYRLVECSPLKKLVFEGDADSVHALDTLTLRGVSSNETEIHYVADLSFQGGLSSFERGLKPWLKGVGRRAVDGMKRSLEGESGPFEERFFDQLKGRLVLPGALSFSQKGYLAMPNKGHTDLMDGKSVVITGPTSGLGEAAAFELSRLGAHLVFVGRDRARLENAARRICDRSGTSLDKIQIFQADLAVVSEVKRVAQELLEKCPRIDVLVHNAGALFSEREENPEGIEKTFALHVLTPWILTETLRPSLEAAQGRVIFVSSGGMYTQRLEPEDFESQAMPFQGAKAYARAKRAQVALCEYWANQGLESKVDYYSMHPGWADTPGVRTSLPSFHRLTKKILRDARMGADTVVWLACSPLVRGISGKFWMDRRIRETSVFPGTAHSEDDSKKLVSYLTHLSHR